jgi:hypothetical protein
VDLPSQTIINVLTFLLPGFITAAMLYSLTPRPRPIPFERVVQALIFTVIIQGAVSGVESSLVSLGNRIGPFGEWTKQTALAWSIALAVVMAAVLAWLDNYDRLHTLWRRLGITYQTSYPSEWFGALSQHGGYVILNLTGSRRLFGFAEEWPNQPDSGHFVIAEGEWLMEDGKRVPLAGVRQILIRATDVEMVELMEIVTGAKDGRSQAADASTEHAIEGGNEPPHQ